MWLECIGVVSRWCCKEVYGYPHNNPLVLALFLAAASLFLCSFLNVFSFLFMLFLYNNYNNYSKRCSKTIRDRSLYR